jgi:hypothetical protein
VYSDKWDKCDELSIGASTRHANHFPLSSAQTAFFCFNDFRPTDDIMGITLVQKAVTDTKLIELGESIVAGKNRRDLTGSKAMAPALVRSKLLKMERS